MSRQCIFEDQERMVLAMSRHHLMMEQYRLLDGSGTDELLLVMVTSINSISPLSVVPSPSLMGQTLRQEKTQIHQPSLQDIL